MARMSNKRRLDWSFFLNAVSYTHLPPMGDLQELSDFFARANSSAFEEKLLFAIDVLKKAELIIFIGMGSSGTLAKRI